MKNHHIHVVRVATKMRSVVLHLKQVCGLPCRFCSTNLDLWFLYMQQKLMARWTYSSNRCMNAPTNLYIKVGLASFIRKEKQSVCLCFFLSHQRRVFDIHIFDENLQKQNIQKSWCHGLINQTLSSSKITNKPLQHSNNQISEQWVFHPIKKFTIDITQSIFHQMVRTILVI